MEPLPRLGSTALARVVSRIIDYLNERKPNVHDATECFPRYAKNGTPCVAYLRMASSLISTPMPGFSETLMKPFSTCGPS